MKKIFLIYFFLNILLCKPCFAQSEHKTTMFLPPLQGLNTSVSPLVLDPKALVISKNVLYDHIGSRKKRGGTTYLNSSAIAESSGSNAVMGIFDFRKIATDGTETRKLISHIDGKVFKMDSFDGTLDNISSGSLTIDKPVDYAVLRKADTMVDTVVMVNGEEMPQFWDQDSSTVTEELTGTPIGIDFYPSCIETHIGRHWAGGVPSYPYRAFHGAGDKYDDWNTVDDAGYWDIIDNYGGKITSILGNYYKYLLIFTDYSLWGISGTSPSDFALFPILPNIGAVNNESVLTYAGDVFWVSYQGIHQLSTTERYGDIEASFLSAPIQEQFNNLRHSMIENCCGAVWSPLNYLIWSFTESGHSTNNICFVYDYIGKRWSTWTGINASCFAVVKNDEDEDELLAGTYDGYINRLNRDTYNDNGSAYTMSISTPFMSFGNPIVNKQFNELFIFLKPQGDSTLDVYYRIDNQISEHLTFSQAGTSGTFGTFRFDLDALGGGALVPRSQSLFGDGKTIQLTIEQDGLNEGAEIYGFGFEFIPTKTEYYQ
ncbi:hypothetical protein KY345_04830 [Candidatus Woesearchaeota archaeon]|nr:hypothetical protein [Candidatus Woesearchaeota archaeon]